MPIFSASEASTVFKDEWSESLVTIIISIKLRIVRIEKKMLKLLIENGAKMRKIVIKSRKCPKIVQRLASVALRIDNKSQMHYIWYISAHWGVKKNDRKMIIIDQNHN